MGKLPNLEPKCMPLPQRKGNPDTDVPPIPKDCKDEVLGAGDVIVGNNSFVLHSIVDGEKMYPFIIKDDKWYFICKDRSGQSAFVSLSDFMNEVIKGKVLSKSKSIKKTDYVYLYPDGDTFQPREIKELSFNNYSAYFMAENGRYAVLEEGVHYRNRVVTKDKVIKLGENCYMVEGWHLLDTDFFKKADIKDVVGEYARLKKDLDLSKGLNIPANTLNGLTRLVNLKHHIGDMTGDEEYKKKQRKLALYYYRKLEDSIRDDIEYIEAPFSTIVQCIRETKGLTQSGFAELLNTSQQTVQKWEAGKNETNLDIKKHIAKVFDYDLDDMLKGRIKMSLISKWLNVKEGGTYYDDFKKSFIEENPKGDILNGNKD